MLLYKSVTKCLKRYTDGLSFAFYIEEADGLTIKRDLDKNISGGTLFDRLSNLKLPAMTFLRLNRYDLFKEEQ